jgi:hypothetical protein
MSSSTLKRTCVLACCIAAASFAASAQSSVPTSGARYGQAAPADATRKEIVVTPDTRWVNVTDGETVRFVVGNQRFTWHVETYPNTTHFNLADIAPSGVDARGVTVYVASNPLYRD